jgi:RimJ/RimL family protein N-acetyltransferase
MENRYLEKILKNADKDPNIAGYVYPEDDSRKRVPIKNATGTTVGFLTPRVENGAWRAGATYVEPEHRGNGYASLALKEFFKDKKGRAYIEDTNVASRKAFEKAGFKEVPGKKIEKDSEVLHLMTKG